VGKRPPCFLCCLCGADLYGRPEKIMITEAIHTSAYSVIGNILRITRRAKTNIMILAVRRVFSLSFVNDEHRQIGLAK
jgi:hypothetical protein